MTNLRIKFEDFLSEKIHIESEEKEEEYSNINGVEESESSETEITIEGIEPDERAPRIKRDKSYEVSYKTKQDGEVIHIEGDLVPFNTGRMIDYKFEPGFFVDKESEEYYDENWEEIEEEIMKKFNEL